MSSPILSIIIPYAGQVDIQPLLASIPLNKSEIEVILIDDRRYLIDVEMKKLCDENRIYYIRNSGKLGAGACRNIGLAKVRGQFVLFADDDDIFSERAFEIILSDIADSARDIYFYSPTSIKPNGSLGRRHKIYEEYIDAYLNNGDKDLMYRFHVPWSKVYRKDFILENNIRFDEVVASNDVFFSVSSGVFAKSIFVSKETIYCVSEREGSLTRKNTADIIVSRLFVYIKVNRFLYENGLKNYRLSLSKYLLILFGLNKLFFLRIFFKVCADFKRQKFVPKKIIGINEIKKVLNEVCEGFRLK